MFTKNLQYDFVILPLISWMRLNFNCCKLKSGCVQRHFGVADLSDWALLYILNPLRFQTQNVLTPTWFEHATFWSGVRRATVAPRSLHRNHRAHLGIDSSSICRKIDKMMPWKVLCYSVKVFTQHKHALLCAFKWHNIFENPKIDWETNYVLPSIKQPSQVV